MNNEEQVKQLTNISFSSQEQMKKLDLYIIKNVPVEKDVLAVITVLLQTNQNVDKLSQIMRKAMKNMGDLHITQDD